MTDTQANEELVHTPPPRAPIEWRAAPGDLEVRFAERIIELLAVPYNQETVVEYPRNSGRLIMETIDPGAFLGVETRPNRVKANRDHDVARSFGKAVAIHPSRAEGLVTEIRVAKTLLGDETLELAEEGVLEPSIGMAVRPSDQVWTDNRSRRRVMRGFYDHVAMCSNPAYVPAPGTSGVLAVRHEQMPTGGLVVPAATPNLDQVTAFLDGLKGG